MRNVLSFILIILSGFSVNAQINTYDWESAGYFTSFTQTNSGLVFTDNYASRLYILKNGQVNVLAETPGCGRYFSLSPDGNTIGFKQIDVKSGLQTPVLLNLNTGKITALHAPVSLCGQITYTAAGNPSFSVGNSVVLVINSELHQYDIHTYSNLTPVSPNGNCFVFNDDNDNYIVSERLMAQNLCLQMPKQAMFTRFGRQMGKKWLIHPFKAIYLYGIEKQTKLFLLAKAENILGHPTASICFIRKMMMVIWHLIIRIFFSQNMMPHYSITYQIRQKNLR